MNEGTRGRLDVSVIGPCEVGVDGVVAQVTAPALRALLLRLIVEPNRIVPVGELADAVWGEELPAGFRRTLQVQLSKLRSLVGADRLLHADDAYRLVLEAGATDVMRFDELVEAGRDAARADDHEVAATLLRRALDLVRGEHAGIHSRSGLVVQEALRVNERTLAANEDLFETELALGRHRDVIDRLDAFCAAHPLRSRAIGQLMLALHRGGRSAHALRVFHDHREFMAEEVGLDPVAELAALERSILDNDPSLEWQPALPVAAPRRMESTPRFLPPELATVGPSFVGRLAEQARLAQAWESARTGEGRLVALGGEAGIGKTRLISELCAQIAGSSLLLFGRCEPDVDVPYRPFIEVLRTAARQLEAHELRATVEGVGRRLVRVIPELSTRLPDIAEEPENDPEVDRYWLFDSVATFLHRLAGRNPVVIVLDDMHWADMASARLLQHLERTVPMHRILVIVAFRASEVDAQHPLHHFAELQAGAGGHVTIQLGGLDEHDVRVFADRTAPGQDLDAGALQARTAGNPFFLQEILRAGAEAAGGAVPPSVSAVVRSRIERLGSNAMSILAAAAVIGPAFRIDLLRAMVGGGDEVVDVIDAGLRTELLVELPEEGSYGFTHALVMDVLLQHLSDARGRLLHAKVAEALEGMHHRDSGRRLAELAHHYVVAAPLGYADEAIDYSRQAARQATSLFAFDEAVTHLERAVALDASSPFGGRLGAALRLELGEMRVRSGDVNAARQSFFEAADLAASVDDIDRLADAAIALMRPIVRVLGRPDPEVEALAKRVAERVGVEPTRRAGLLHGALALRLRDGSPERIEATRIAAEIAAQVDDPETSFVSVFAHFWDLFRTSGPGERAEVTQTLIDSVGENLSEQRLEARLLRIYALIELGDGEAIRREVRAFGRDVDALPLRFYQAVRSLLQALVALIDGRLVEAERLTFSALDLFGGDELGLQGVATQLFLVRFAQGRLGELEPVMAAAAARSPLVAAFSVAQTVIYAETGRIEEAAQGLKQLVGGEPAIPVLGDPGRCLTLVMAARAAGVIGDAATAEVVYPLLSQYVDQGVAMSVVATGGSVARYLASIAPLVGEDPEPLYAKAIAFNERLQAPHLVAATQLSWAAQCRADGRESQATSLIAAAAPVAEQLGMGGPEMAILSGR